MSIFSAMDTAVSGLTAQSVAFSNISNNISNSQTVGYKSTDTSFADYVEASSATAGQSSSVIATTQYANQAQGTITASSANGALAINGSGFFAVNEISGTSTTTAPALSATQYYTRSGDFKTDNNGYLVNSAGEYLDGYAVSSTGGTSTTASTLSPININNITYSPTATANVTVAATLPTASATATLPAAAVTSTITAYDANGIAKPLTMTWQQTGAADSTVTPATGGTYSLSVTGTATTLPTAQIVFNADGTIQSFAPDVTNPGATASPSSYNIGPVGSDTTSISLNLGTLNSGAGTNMATATTTAFNSGAPTQDGTSAGKFSSFSMETDGSVVATFDNGQSQVFAKVPLAMFANADGLKTQDGQAYTATSTSGAANLQLAGQNGAGSFETKSVEASTSSLDTDLTKLIVAQQAYAASAKVVTTANDMLQTALGMKQ
ncbi:flagellar hook protein FlgE [Lichenicoccus roseus]|uniref:Flagellar hook protein FlgE n=1 Tax=Lichenicoccus roseus TaxID=2683649 RepID=A0A5R9IYC5_9PROT|nr:flagellar hook protein FlgE [Lichenicoccus roseus]TLU70494.1 flagellar hook protein FlgE [Lichenicoccus roseus]